MIKPLQFCRGFNYNCILPIYFYCYYTRWSPLLIVLDYIWRLFYLKYVIMIRVFLALITTFTLFGLYSCTKSSENRAKDLVKEYIKKNSHDQASYDPVEFGKLDSFKMSVIFSKEYREVLEDYTTSDEGSLHHADALHELWRMREDPVLNPPAFVMTHKYRGKNSLGVIVLSESDFYLNKTLDSVIYIDSDLSLRRGELK